MSLVFMTNDDDDDDDNHSLSSSTNTDDETVESNFHTHRSCSLHAACNRKNHQHMISDPATSISLINNSKPVKGDLRTVDNELGHQQKFDGYKWRRVCSTSDCLMYLNGGAFYDNWLCRKHYLSSLSEESSTTRYRFKSTIKSTRKSYTRPSYEEITPHKRGDIEITNDGIRQKYNGKIWRPVCNYENCNSYIVAHGYCHRHDLEIRTKRSKILSSLNHMSEPNSILEPRITRSTPIPTPQKGDIQLIRQQWNGNKWFSLCNYHTQDCTRRSGGIKHAHLCDIHYKESLEKAQDPDASISLSPIVKRKRSINHDSNHSSNNIIPCRFIVDQTQQTERCIQTDVTYPLESNDLREGCFLIEDDADEPYRRESAGVMVYVKKEEETYANNKRKLFNNINSLPMNCKIEITKLEF